MNKLVFVVLTAASMAGVVLGDGGSEQKISGRLRAAGGPFVLEGKGCVAILNAQNVVGTESIDKSIEQLKVVARDYSIVSQNVDFSLSAAKTAYENAGASAAVYIINDSSLPMSLIAIEDCWGFVNVAKLGAGVVAPEKLEKRYQKEFVRVASLVFGGGCSQFQFSALQSARSADDLDAIVGATYGMDTAVSINKHLKDIGLKPSVQMTYRSACEQGIALPPTNEMQKVVWDKVHETPKKPIRIKFDPKNDK